MQVEDRAISDQAPPEEDGSGRARLPLRWRTLAEAAELLGISPTAVRRQIQAGRLTGLRAGRTWRVLLAGDLPSEAAAEEAPAAGREADYRPAVEALERTQESLSALIQDLQRQSLTLAGQVGYLQSQLSSAQERIEQLNARPAIQGLPDGAVSAVEHQSALDTITALRGVIEQQQAAQTPVAPAPKRRWWRR